MLKVEKVKNLRHIISRCTTLLQEAGGGGGRDGKRPDAKRKLFALVAFPARRRCSPRAWQTNSEIGTWPCGEFTAEHLASVNKAPAAVGLRADLISFCSAASPLILDSLLRGVTMPLFIPGVPWSFMSHVPSPVRLLPRSLIKRDRGTEPRFSITLETEGSERRAGKIQNGKAFERFVNWELNLFLHNAIRENVRFFLY